MSNFAQKIKALSNSNLSEERLSILDDIDSANATISMYGNNGRGWTNTNREESANHKITGILWDLEKFDECLEDIAIEQKRREKNRLTNFNKALKILKIDVQLFWENKDLTVAPDLLICDADLNGLAELKRLKLFKIETSDSFKGTGECILTWQAFHNNYIKT